MRPHFLITGGSRSLGLVLVRRFLAADYAVTTISRTKGPELRRLEQTHGETLQVLEADLSDIQGLPDLIAKISGRGQIQGLINNAATGISGLLVSINVAEIEQTIRTNLTSVIVLSRLVAKQMVRAHCGRIITISSIAARIGYRGLSAYSATKAGVEGFTRSLARELGSRNITVNAIAPGFLETEMTRSLTAQQTEQIRNRTPMGRLATSDDVADVALFLASPAAKMITGTVIPVDGGASA